MGLKQLEFLSLAGTNVTDAGLKELAGLKQLRTLELDGTKVTDAGLKELVGLKQLRTLVIGDTKVTRTGSPNFKKPYRMQNQKLNQPLLPGQPSTSICSRTATSLRGIVDRKQAFQNLRIRRRFNLPSVAYFQPIASSVSITGVYLYTGNGNTTCYRLEMSKLMED